jgi:hypothetical protein
VMLTGLIVASSNLNPEGNAKSKPKATTSPKPQAKNYFEERWNKRQGE